MSSSNCCSQRSRGGGFKAAEESRRSREETTLQIRKSKKDARLAKRRQMPTGGLSAPTPAGLAAASMLVNSGDNTYASMMENSMSTSSSQSQINAVTAAKLEQLPMMVQGVMGNDPATQTECTTQFRRLLSIEKSPPIQQVIDAGVVPRFVEFLQRDDNPALQFEAAWVRCQKIGSLSITTNGSFLNWPFSSKTHSFVDLFLSRHSPILLRGHRNTPKSSWKWVQFPSLCDYSCPLTMMCENKPFGHSETLPEIHRPVEISYCKPGLCTRSSINSIKIPNYPCCETHAGHFPTFVAENRNPTLKWSSPLCQLSHNWYSRPMTKS
jgi:hypothetical protein